MTASESLEKHFLDLLAPIGGITARPMFGAVCLFRDGAAFAIVDDGSLFFKSDDETRAAMKKGGGRAFTYEHKEKGTVEMSYCSPPESAFDDADELRTWARKAIAIAAAKKKPAKKKPAAQKAAKKKTQKKK